MQKYPGEKYSYEVCGMSFSQFSLLMTPMQKESQC